MRTTEESLRKYNKVHALLKEGLRNVEICRALNMSSSTVSCYKKFNTHEEYLEWVKTRLKLIVKNDNKEEQPKPNSHASNQLLEDKIVVLLSSMNQTLNQLLKIEKDKEESRKAYRDKNNHSGKTLIREISFLTLSLVRETGINKLIII